MYTLKADVNNANRNWRQHKPLVGVVGVAVISDRAVHRRISNYQESTGDKGWSCLRDRDVYYGGNRHLRSGEILRQYSHRGW